MNLRTGAQGEAELLFVLSDERRGDLDWVEEPRTK
jgi:hypothetical protein